MSSAGKPGSIAGSTTQKNRPDSKSRSRTWRSCGWVIRSPTVKARSATELPFLLRRDGLDLESADIEGGVDAEIVGGYRGGDEARGGRPESDGADLHPLDNFVFQPLVVHLDVVVAAEIPLGIVVHVDMEPASDQAAGQDVELVIDPGGGEPAPATRSGIEQCGGRAPFVADPVRPDLDPGCAVDRQIGVF